MTGFIQDLRYGLRMLAKSPGFTAIAVMTLALGIGANTAIFTMIDALMLRSLPVKDPGQLALFYDGPSTGNDSSNGIQNDIYSYPFWQFLRDHNQAFEGICAFRQGDDQLAMQVDGPSGPSPREQVRGHLVSGSYFQVLGVHAIAGRTLRPEDDKPGSPPSAVISYDFWRRRFNLDGSVMGKTVDLNGTAFTVVGAAPPKFFGERVREAPDFWLPLSWQPQILQRESWLAEENEYWLNLMGRLKPGGSRESAQVTLNTQLHQYYTAQAGVQVTPARQREIAKAHIQLQPGARGISVLRFAYSRPLHVLMAVVALVLLIACANVATLLLARSSVRRHEVFVRLALGSSRGRLIRQLLTESLLLALGGGAAGIILAVWAVHLLVAIFPVPAVVKLQPDLVVLAFAVAISLLTGVLFGIIPAWRSTNLAVRSGAATRSESGGTLFKPAYALVVVQVALSSILLVGAALLTHSLLDLESQNLGFNAGKLLLVRTDPKLAGLQPAEMFPFYRDIQQRLDSLPGVTSACIARFSPMSGSVSRGNFSLEGYEPPAGEDLEVFDLVVGPKFFETLGVPLLLGRTVGVQDTPTSPQVAIVNEAFVRRYLPGRNPLGLHMNLGAPFKAPGAEIVGVVADSRYYSMRERPEPMVFFSLWQAAADPHFHRSGGELMIRTSQEPAGMIAEVRQTLKDQDARLPILKITTLSDQVRDSIRDERMITLLCNVFGALALLLTCIGLYGTMAYSVARRTSEIGLRMALGAQRSTVLWMFLRHSLALVALGLVVGLPSGLAASHWIRSYFFGLPRVDWVGISCAIAVMVAVAAVAAFVPARRATKVDPMVALRYE